MDAKAVGMRIKEARTFKNLTQEDLAALVELSTTHISVIERGIKSPKLETFVAIANALEVSADALLIDVVDKSIQGYVSELAQEMSGLPAHEQRRIIKAIQVLISK